MRLEGPFWCPGAAGLATVTRKRRFGKAFGTPQKKGWILSPAGPAERLNQAILEAIKSNGVRET